MISGSNEQLQQEFEYTLLNPDCHSWWISKMQSGCQDTLGERYAIKLCFKLGKMRQKCMECFRLLLDHLAWNKHQFLSGKRDSRKSVRDDESCRRSKEVRTPELIGQIKNFMDKDCRVSIETISAQFDVSVGTVLTIICWTEDVEDLCEVYPKGAQRRSERKAFSWQHGDGRADQFRSRSYLCSGDLRWKLDLMVLPRDQEIELPVEACWLS